MEFQYLELMVALSWHHELEQGDLRLVMHLEALGLSGRPGRLQLLQKHWRESESESVPVWRETVSEVSLAATQRLVETIRLLWKEGRPPRLECQPIVNTTWHSVLCTIRLDGQTGVLSLEGGELAEMDRAGIHAFFRELAALAGVTASRNGFPRHLLGMDNEANPI